MESSTIQAQQWAEEQFANCDLGDKRRTRRLISVATLVAEKPAASFPQQFAEWSDLKAAYRLFDAEQVTFAAIASPHWQRTRTRGPGRYLLIGDTTEIDFGIQRDIEGLAPTGNGGGYGFLLHSALLVHAQDETIVGLAGQTIHYRTPAPKKENTTQRLRRERESEVWGKVIDQVGSPPPGAQFVHVLDRGADNFEVYCHCYEQQANWVVRVCQIARKIRTSTGQSKKLREYLRELPVAGSYQLQLRARPKQAARTAQLEVRIGSLQVPTPVHRSPYVQRIDPGPITMRVVWVRETHAPAGVEPIEWVLYTSLGVDSLAEAMEVIGYYEKRWLIEEWHKALKTGCKIEDRQLETPERLEAMLGLMSVVAVRLLQLKSLARTEPDRPAHAVVPRSWIEMLIAARRLKATSQATLTVYQFYRELAKLGGFLGRKHDGEPGWITIWRGWGELNNFIRGYELGKNIGQRCG